MSGDKARPGARPAPEPGNALTCDAPGCLWAGSAGGQGRFLCIAHQGAESRDLARISERTTELSWFAQYIADVQRMHNFPRKGEEGWIAYATQFWEANDTSMQPTPTERRNGALYLYRMLAELRAMALGKERPAPHVPQAATAEFGGMRAEPAGVEMA